MKRLLVLVIAILMLVSMVGCSSTDNSEIIADLQKEIEELEDTIEELENTIKEYESQPVTKENTLETVSEETLEETPEPSVELTGYEAGMYKIGTDMPAGIYKLIADDEWGGSWSIATDSSGEFESEVASDAFNTFMLAKVEDEQYFKLDSCHAVNVEEVGVLEPIDGVYEQGMYRVGIDIPAGEYKVTADGIMPMYSIYSDLDYTYDSLLAIDSFDNEIYLTIEDGQYLKLYDAYIKVK